MLYSLSGLFGLTGNRHRHFLGVTEFPVFLKVKLFQNTIILYKGGQTLVLSFMNCYSHSLVMFVVKYIDW